MYPISLNVEEKKCVIVGGGQVAERKISGLIHNKCHILIVSPRLTGRLQTLVAEKKVTWLCKHYETGDLQGAFLVFAATNDSAVQAAILLDARNAGVLINVADAPGDCDFHVPAVLNRGDLQVTVSTQGKSPAVAALVKQHLADCVGPEYAALTTLAGLIREQILSHQASDQEKRLIFQKILNKDLLHWLRTKQWQRIKTHLEKELGQPLDFDLTVQLEEHS